MGEIRIAGTGETRGYPYPVRKKRISIPNKNLERYPGPDSISNESSSDNFDFDTSSTMFREYFSIVHYNVHSLLPKLDAVECELNKFDVIAVTETWLNPTISDNDISIRGYKAPYRYNRPNDNHGGVAVYVNDNIYTKRRHDLEIRNIECVWIEARAQRKPVLIGTFYRPPNADASVLLDIETSIDLAIDTGINDIIITGDLNVDYLKENTRKKLLIYAISTP